MFTKTYSSRTRLIGPALVLFSLIGILMLGWVIVENDLVQVKDDTYALLFMPLLLLLFTFLVVNAQNRRLSVFSRPSNLFILFFVYFVGLGSISQYFRVISGRPLSYTESLSMAYLVSSLALACWLIGHQIYCLLPFIGPRHRKKTTYPAWNPKRLFRVALFWGGLGSIFMLLFYQRIGGVPVLRGLSPNVDQSLGELLAGDAHLISVMAFNANSIGTFFSGTYLAAFGYNPIMFSLFVVGIILFIGWGPRIYFVIPILVVGLMYLRRKQVKMFHVILVLAIFFILSILFARWRNRSFSNIYQTDPSTVVESLADIHLAPEFREHLGVLSNLEELSHSYTGRNIRSAILYTTMPNIVWTNIFGIDKNQIFEESSAWIIAKVVRNNLWTGIRSGFKSEVIMAFGLSGIVISFFGLGLLFSWLDSKAASNPFDSSNILMIYVITVLFSFLIIGQIESVFSRLWYIIYIFIPMKKLASSTTEIPGI